MTTAASALLGERSFSMDLGVKLGLSISTDATAGAAISSRKSIGRVKYLTTLFLWVQDGVTRGEIKIKKVHTSVSPSDILTKAVPSSTNLVDDGDHELQIREGPSWTDIDGMSMAWSAKVVFGGPSSD